MFIQDGLCIKPGQTQKNDGITFKFEAAAYVPVCWLLWWLNTHDAVPRFEVQGTEWDWKVNFKNQFPNEGPNFSVLRVNLRWKSYCWPPQYRLILWPEHNCIAKDTNISKPELSHSLRFNLDRLTSACHRIFLWIQLLLFIDIWEIGS